MYKDKEQAEGFVFGTVTLFFPGVKRRKNKYNGTEYLLRLRTIITPADTVLTQSFEGKKFDKVLR